MGWGCCVGVASIRLLLTTCLAATESVNHHHLLSSCPPPPPYHTFVPHSFAHTSPSYQPLLSLSPPTPPHSAGKALEKALLAFHHRNMENINRLIKEYWQKTYRNQDIDYIQVRGVGRVG